MAKNTICLEILIDKWISAFVLRYFLWKSRSKDEFLRSFKYTCVEIPIEKLTSAFVLRYLFGNLDRKMNFCVRFEIIVWNSRSKNEFLRSFWDIFWKFWSNNEFPRSFWDMCLGISIEKCISAFVLRYFSGNLDRKMNFCFRVDISFRKSRSTNECRRSFRDIFLEISIDKWISAFVLRYFIGNIDRQMNFCVRSEIFSLKSRSTNEFLRSFWDMFLEISIGKWTSAFVLRYFLELLPPSFCWEFL